MSGVAVRFDCPGCGPTRARGFRVIEPRLWLRCARCGREHPAEPAMQPAASAAPPAGPGRRRAPPPDPGVRPATSPVRSQASGPNRSLGPRTDASRPGPELEAPREVSRPVPGLELLEGGASDPDAAFPPPDARPALLLPPIPPGICPSCLRERPAIQPHCAGCGLDFLKTDPATFAPSARLSRAWAALSEQWDQLQAHARFLEGARAADEVREAARLYRLYLLSSPEDPHARGALEKLVAETLAMAAATRTGRPPPEGLEAGRRTRLLIAALLLSLLLAGLAMMT